MYRLLFLFFLFLISCNQNEETNVVAVPTYELNQDQANRLLSLPLDCVQKEYPNKLQQTLLNSSHIAPPKELHPAFYGCFDWHSSVHGHWSAVKLVKAFPELEDSEKAVQMLTENITEKNIQQEIEYFKRSTETSYERTYGWAWLLQLQLELDTWQSETGKELSRNLQPLTDLIVKRYLEYLPKLIYPIRVGEHTNTAFGLSFAYDYAVQSNQTELKELIESRARDFYTDDAGCPIDWEPSGYDFLSPCLQEVDIMRKVLTEDEFSSWIADFMPELGQKDLTLEVGRVSDRTDGKLVHLDGLNFSRAWVFYGLATQYEEYAHLVQVGNLHMEYSYPNLLGDSYEGSHWLGSFAIYAMREASLIPRPKN